MTIQEKKDIVTNKVPSKRGEENNSKEKRIKIKKEDLTEEEIKRKEDLELLISKLKDKNEDIVKLSLDLLNKEIVNTSGLLSTSLLVLKILRNHYDFFIEVYNTMPFIECKKKLSNMISALSATIGDKNNIIKYLITGNKEDLINYGHEYIKNVMTYLLIEYKLLREEESNNTMSPEIIYEKFNHLYDLVNIIVPYCFNHNTEYEGIDLLIEVDRIVEIPKYIQQEACDRSILYLLNLSHYSSSTEDYNKLMNVIYTILNNHHRYIDCLRILLRMNNRDSIKSLIFHCTDQLVCKQIALICARHSIYLEFTDEELNRYPYLDLNQIQILSSGEHLSPIFLKLAQELEVDEPKLPEDIYKTHLEERRTSCVWDSAKQNLSSSFVNAFLNAGFCKDKLMTVDSSVWIYKNKDYGIMSATASMGLLLLWNIEEGLSQIDMFQYSSNSFVKSGALMAFGLVCSNIKNDCDPAYALLSEHVESTNNIEKIGALLGFGYAYAGSNRDNLLEFLVPSLVDNCSSVECSVFAAISLGLVFVGSQNREVAEYIIDTILEREKISNSLDLPISRLYGVALGLLYLCAREKCEATLTALEVIKHPIVRYIAVTVEGMAFAGSNDVLKVQKMLHICVEKRNEMKTDEKNVNENKMTNDKNDTNDKNIKNVDNNINKITDYVNRETKDKKKDQIKQNKNKNNDNHEEDTLDQCVAILNIALIALTDDISTEMSIRTFDHFLQFSNVHQKKAIPLAFALLFTSYPKPNIVDILSKLTHDQDPDVALHAIISLGIVGAGTNNSKIAVLLRQLSAFYCKDTNAIFVVRLAQGLLYMGKGLLTINPLHSNRSVINLVALGSLLVTLHSLLQLKATILGKYHYLLYHLVPSIYPRMLVTVDENINPITVNVRVGQAVDVVAQAGKPKKITGFQTHTTPVLLLHTDRAELATDEYIPVSDTLEGVVILKKNPNYIPAVNN